MSHIKISLPNLHVKQREAWETRSRFNAIRCGRRWGKTNLSIAIIGTKAIKGEYWGIFAPDYKIMSETYRDLENCLLPVTAHSNKTEGLIRTINNGRIDFWTLNNPKAGRSRKYHGVVIDEAAFAGDDMVEIWRKAIRPTLFDFKGSAWALSTPDGKRAENWFYQICQDEKSEWKEYHAPSWTNPHLPEEEIERLRKTEHPKVFAQEYGAEFVDFSGDPIFRQEWLLVDGQPVSYPTACDSIFAILDTSVKGGQEHDGTAISWWAHSTFGPYRLIALDWDVIQIDGALLEHIMPRWLEHGISLAKQCGARFGFTGIYIEDAAAGALLLQQGQTRGWPVEATPSDLLSVGKDGRALNASGAVYRGEVKFSDVAYTKNDVMFKDVTKNHFVSQVCSYQIGDKNAARRADDLFDTFVYAVAIVCGDSSGIG